MKISSHTIIVEDYPQAGQHLVFSTRTQALVKIDQGLKDALEAVRNNSPLLPLKYKADLERMYHMGFLVRDEEEEQAKLKEFLRQLKYGYDRALFAVTILTTYACNLKCVYCFEESSRENVKLDFETQELAIGWLKRRVERLGYRKLLINYYGGEPLLNPRAIEHVSREMQAWCRDKGIQFGITLQTNGYLMTPQMLDRLLPFNLKKVRISVDGIKASHDANRPLRGGGGTFERIIKNIVDCVDKTEICLSMGHEKDDVAPIAELIGYLEELGVLSKLGEFIFSPIIPSVGPKGHPEMIRGSECMCNQEDRTMAGVVTKLQALMKAKDLKYTSNMSVNACGLVRENSGVTIDQHGRLYRCNSLLGHPEFAIGDVRRDEFNAAQQEFRDLDVWRQCPVDCAYLPMCSGGCRLMSFVGGNKNFKVASCKKPYLNEMSPGLIKRQYEQMTARKKELSPKAVVV